MTSEALKLVGQIAMAVIASGALVAAINNWLSPKVKKETQQIAAAVARQEVADRITNLKESLDEADERAEAAATRATAAEARANRLAKRLDDLQAAIEEAHEQIDLNAEQITELRKANLHLTRQNQILSQLLQVAEDHAREYFARRNEPMPANWPKSQPFTEGV